MPKSNRPLVRDGRIQPPKKRTDRSYLRPGPSAAEIAETSADMDGAVEAPADEVAVAAPMMPPAAPVPAAPAAVQARPAAVSGKLPTTVRAIQQQGVRKRGAVDLQALAQRDTRYAFHELRRIAVLSIMVIATLVVLWFILR